jgi:hypothetical protein
MNGKLILGKSCMSKVLLVGRGWRLVWVGSAVGDLVAEDTSDLATKVYGTCQEVVDILCPSAQSRCLEAIGTLLNCLAQSSNQQ